MYPKDADRMVNSACPEEQSDLGLHCWLRPISISLKTKVNYDKTVTLP